LNSLASSNFARFSKFSQHIESLELQARRRLPSWGELMGEIESDLDCPGVETRYKNSNAEPRVPSQGCQCLAQPIVGLHPILNGQYIACGSC
jgi:hypothetical protein